MRCSFFIKALAASLVAVSHAADMKHCDEGPFAGTSPNAGRVAGGLTCHTQWTNGEVIVGIEAWAGDYQLKALRVKTSRSGWGELRGQIPPGNLPPEKHSIVEWASTDQVGIRLWNNKHDPVDAVGRIVITKGGQNILDVNSGYAAESENFGDNGSGLLLAIKTGSGIWLDYVEFKMLKSKVMRAELVDVQVSDDLKAVNEQQKGIKEIAVDSMYFANDNPIGGGKMEYSLARSSTLTTSKEVTSETTNEWGAGVGITVGASVGVPFFSASVETSTAFEFSNTQFSGTTTREEKSDTWEYSFSSHADTPLEPQTAAICKATATSGQYTGPYIGTIEVTLADGTTYKYQDRGDVKTINWHKSGINCTTVPLTKVPLGVERGPASPVQGEPEAEDPKKKEPKEDETTDEPEEEPEEGPEGENTDEPADEEAPQSAAPSPTAPTAKSSSASKVAAQKPTATTAPGKNSKRAMSFRG